MYKRYPSIQSMHAFLQAARTGSFTKAAQQLDLTHSAISQQIRSLEEFIGQPLFVREAGGIVLTDAGQLFASMLTDGFGQVDRALSSVRNRHVPQTLIVDVDSELAQGWLNARLPQLLAALPGYQVMFLSTPRGERPSFERVDVSLRYGYGEWDDCEMALICGDHVTAVAAPALLERHGVQAPLAPSAAMTLPLLGYTRRSWIPWLDAAALEPLEPAVVAAFDNAANMVAAAEAGVGVALVRGLLAADALQHGRLVRLTDVAIPAHYNLYAVWQRGQGERAQAVVNAVQQLARDTLGA
ncbi:LysR family transcriptional regulator [Ralstonia sp.]|uniref:LysR family transcriptional regulator n=1 Tax=Ralstonia sp. TaxID=54061 RepID=UPI0031D17282